MQDTQETTAPTQIEGAETTVHEAPEAPAQAKGAANHRTLDTEEQTHGHDDRSTDPATEDDADEQPDERGKAGREAARYRVQLREAREHAAHLTEQLARLQTAEVARLASEHLSVGGDLLEYGAADLSAFLLEDGTVDAALVAEAAKDLVKARPGLSRHPRRTDPHQGQRGFAGRAKSDNPLADAIAARRG